MFCNVGTFLVAIASFGGSAAEIECQCYSTYVGLLRLQWNTKEVIKKYCLALDWDGRGDGTYGMA